MPKDDYSSAGGGALKLKGAKNAGVDKKRKKKKKPEIAGEGGEASSGKDALGELQKDDQEHETLERHKSTEVVDQDKPTTQAIKTESERKHEEMRRRRLDERLKREGVKTHKERVEELNKYLSTLSEHHDMPRIGPG